MCPGRPSGLITGRINDLLRKKDDFLNWRNRADSHAVILIGNGIFEQSMTIGNTFAAMFLTVEMAPICTLNHGRFAVFTALFRRSELVTFSFFASLPQASKRRATVDMDS